MPGDSAPFAQIWLRLLVAAALALLALTARAPAQTPGPQPGPQPEPQIAQQLFGQTHPVALQPLDGPVPGWRVSADGQILG